MTSSWTTITSRASTCCSTQSPARYVPGLLLFGFVQLALNSYFFGLAAALDRSGRWAAALQGYSLIPYALGPGLFGSLLHGGKLSSLAWPAVGVNLLGLALLSPVLIRLERGPLSEDFATPADRLASHALLVGVGLSLEKVVEQFLWRVGPVDFLD